MRSRRCCVDDRRLSRGADEPPATNRPPACAREVREHLRDSAAAHRAAGLTPGDAELRATAEFGSVETVAGRLGGELAIRETRIAALLSLGAIAFSSSLSTSCPRTRCRPPRGSRSRMSSLCSSALRSASGLRRECWGWRAAYSHGRAGHERLPSRWSPLQRALRRRPEPRPYSSGVGSSTRRVRPTSPSQRARAADPGCLRRSRVVDVVDARSTRSEPVGLS